MIKCTIGSICSRRGTPWRRTRARTGATFSTRSLRRKRYVVVVVVTVVVRVFGHQRRSLLATPLLVRRGASGKRLCTDHVLFETRTSALRSRLFWGSAHSVRNEAVWSSGVAASDQFFVDLQEGFLMWRGSECRQTKRRTCATDRTKPVCTYMLFTCFRDCVGAAAAAAAAATPSFCVPDARRGRDQHGRGQRGGHPDEHGRHPCQALPGRVPEGVSPCLAPTTVPRAAFACSQRTTPPLCVLVGRRLGYVRLMQSSVCQLFVDKCTSIYPGCCGIENPCGQRNTIRA